MSGIRYVVLLTTDPDRPRAELPRRVCVDEGYGPFDGDAAIDLASRMSAMFTDCTYEIRMLPYEYVGREHEYPGDAVPGASLYSSLNGLVTPTSIPTTATPDHDEEEEAVEFSRCDNCRTLTPEDEMEYVNHGDYVCRSCYEDYGTCRECGYEAPGIEGVCGDCRTCCSEEGEPLRRCTDCGTLNVHFHELTERFLCDCEMEKARRNREPVLVAA